MVAAALAIGVTPVVLGTGPVATAASAPRLVLGAEDNRLIAYDPDTGRERGGPRVRRRRPRPRPRPQRPDLRRSRPPRLVHRGRGHQPDRRGRRGSAGLGVPAPHRHLARRPRRRPCTPTSCPPTSRRPTTRRTTAAGSCPTAASSPPTSATSSRRPPPRGSSSSGSRPPVVASRAPTCRTARSTSGSPPPAASRSTVRTACSWRPTAPGVTATDVTLGGVYRYEGLPTSPSQCTRRDATGAPLVDAGRVTEDALHPGEPTRRAHPERRGGGAGRRVVGVERPHRRHRRVRRANGSFVRRVLDAPVLNAHPALPGRHGLRPRHRRRGVALVLRHRRRADAAGAGPGRRRTARSAASASSTASRRHRRPSARTSVPRRDGARPPDRCGPPRRPTRRPRRSGAVATGACTAAASIAPSPGVPDRDHAADRRARWCPRGPCR